MEKRASRARKTSIDPDKGPLAREFSAGGVVFKKKGEQVLWLVAKSAPSNLIPKGFWRLPKGWLDDDEDGKNPGLLGKGERKATEDQLQMAAAREVEEEGGAKASVVKKITTDRFFFTLRGKRILKFVTYYLMEWVRDLPEGPGLETDEVKWLPFEGARKTLKHSGEKKILDKAKTLLDLGVQENLL